MSEENAPVEGGSAAPAETGPDATKTYTSEELDRIVAERVNRSKAQFKDYADLKAKAEQLDKLTAERQTDLEKAVSRAEKAEAKFRAEAEQREQLVSQLRENTVRSEVFRTAATAEASLADSLPLSGAQIWLSESRFGSARLSPALLPKSLRSNCEA